MDTVTISVVAALIAVLVSRELMWRGAFVALRGELAADAVHMKEDERRQIQANVTRAAGMVRNLFAFIETSTRRLRWQDINELAGRAVDGMRADLTASVIRVTVALADRLPLMYVDDRTAAGLDELGKPSLSGGLVACGRSSRRTVDRSRSSVRPTAAIDSIANFRWRRSAPAPPIPPNGAP